MRSLWRLMASRWLGGGTEASAGDSPVADILRGAPTPAAFHVSRDPRARPSAGAPPRAAETPEREDLDHEANRRD